eukprot:UN06007
METRYYNNKRYVNFWFAYANSVQDKLPVIEFMRKQGIGLKTVSLWQILAYVTERKGEGYQKSLEIWKDAYACLDKSQHSQLDADGRKIQTAMPGTAFCRWLRKNNL